MNTVKILHCADLHIGAPSYLPGEKGQSRRADALITFENIIELCRGHNVDIMLIAGDLFASNSVEHFSVTRVLDCISSLENTKVVFSAGNHDPLNFESPFKSLRLPDNFHILPVSDSFVSFDDLKARVYGRSFSDVYTKGENRFSITTEPDFINIMCQHGELKSDLSSNYNSITPEFIENSGMDYIALGHIHKRTQVQSKGNTFFAYSGCTQGLGFDELGVKGVLLGNVGKGVCDLEFYKTCVRTHECLNIDISDVSDSAQISEKILHEIKTKYQEGFENNLYKIVLVGSVADGFCADTAEIADRLMQSVYFAKVRDDTSVLQNLDIIKNENSLKGIFVSKMLDRINSCKPEEKNALSLALNLGLKAFSSEVNYNED